MSQVNFRGLIHPLGPATAGRVDLVGAKAANLAELLVRGLPVPRGFVLARSCLDRLLKMNGINDELGYLLAQVDTHQVLHDCDLGGRIRALVQTLVLPQSLCDALIAAWESLGAEKVAVRSSSSMEDLAALSFAGQHDSFTQVDTAEKLLARVKDVWASLWSDRALGYLRSRDVSVRGLGMSVLVQVMAGGNRSGVLFTANPKTGNRAELCLSAVSGWGERLVEGECVPDEWVLVRPEGGGDHEAPLSGASLQMKEMRCEGTAALLSEAQVRGVARLGLRAESILGLGPLDMEWGLCGKDMFVLQARPISQLPEDFQVSWVPPVEGTHWCRTWRLGEWLSDPVTPLFASWGLPLLVHSREQFGSGHLGWEHLPTFSMPQPWYTVVHGYFFTRQELPAESGGGMPLPRRLERLRSLRENLGRWRAKHLPAYLALLQERRCLNVSGMESLALVELVDTLLKEAGEFWYLIAPIGYGFEALVFKPLYEAILSSESRPHYSQLFRGYPGRVIDGQQMLFQLYRRMQADPALVACMTGHSCRALAEQEDLLPAWVQQVLAAYVADYGHQLQSLDFYFPTLGEMRIFPLQYLQSMLRFGGRDPLAALEVIRRQRDAACAKVLDELLLGHPQRHIMAEMIEGFQFHAEVREDAIFYFQAGWPMMRQCLRALGARLVAGQRLDRPDQVFFLQRHELERLLTAPGREDYAGLARSREVTWQAQRQLQPPDFLPPEGRHGQVRQPTGLVQDEQGQRFLGQGVSSGKVRGPVRIIRSCDHVSGFLAGDILVTKTACPSLTPLMLMAGGLIVDAGGGASHSSLVARELGLPTVVNTQSAVTHLRDGQLVEVDGSSGVVRLLSQ